MIFKAAIYKSRQLQDLIEDISVSDAEALIRKSLDSDLQVRVAAFLEDGRHLQGVYEEMGPTVYEQPFAVHAKDAEDLEEVLATLKSIEPQYLANANYVERERRA